MAFHIIRGRAPSEFLNINWSNQWNASHVAG